MYLLDTNACIQILNDTSEALLRKFRQHDPADVKICAVVRAELVYGARRSTRVQANMDLLQRFFSLMECLPLDEESADHYGQIRVDLERSGTSIGPNDLMIAAIARSRDLILVTHNTREFSRVPGLKIEDWELSET
jgi:tRNA(fMet)-specific endonuclease VapC